MGKAHSGKTSMRSIIFANYLARDTMRLSPTLDVEHHHVRFLGDLVLNLWDCGGQDTFYESYFERDRETIFRSVEMLIYVFDIESDTPEKDFDHFAGVLEAIEENSPDARIFVLVHKMDLVAEEERDVIFDDRRRLVEECCAGCGVRSFRCFGTSIWDETLYKAWSEIVTNLIPNIGVLESHLRDFCRICDADEVVLFERATFLVISHAQQAPGADTDRPALDQGGGASTADALAAATVETESGPTAEAIVGDVGATATAATAVEGSSSVASSPPQGAPLAGSGGGGGDNLGEVPGESGGVGGEPIEDGTDAGAGGGGGGTAAAPMTAPSAEDSSAAVDDANAAALATTRAPANSSPQFDAHRFEKISNIVKQFKLSCGKAQSQFQGMEVRNSKFSAFIDAFTANTYIMVIVSRGSKGGGGGKNVHTAATLINIRNARRHFERFIPRS